MSGYTTAIATCPQDTSVAAQASLTIEQLADALETFRDKQPAEALSDLHRAILNWEEINEGLGQESDVDLTIRVTTDGTTWDFDVLHPDWIIDLPMSIFHGRLFFKANVEDPEG